MNTDPTDKKPSSNIPSELSGAKSQEIKFNPQDPETAAAIAEFMEDKAKEITATANPQPEDGTPVEKGRVSIPPNAEFDGGDAGSNVITDTMSPLDKITVSDSEKELFLKAILSDEPVRLTIPLYKGRLLVEMRSRTAYEQRRVMDILTADSKEGYIEKGDYPMFITRLHYYLGALMVERINGELFSEAKIETGKSLEADTKMMRDLVAKLYDVSKMENAKWISILNALRIFEHKCAKLNSEAANEDFWNPQGSA